MFDTIKLNTPCSSIYLKFSQLNASSEVALNSEVRAVDGNIILQVSLDD